MKVVCQECGHDYCTLLTHPETAGGAMSFSKHSLDHWIGAIKRGDAWAHQIHECPKTKKPSLILLIENDVTVPIVTQKLPIKELTFLYQPKIHEHYRDVLPRLQHIITPWTGRDGK